MKSTAVTVAATPTLIIPADNKNRDIYLHSSTGSTYIGGSTVSSSTGLHLPNGTTMTVFVPASETLYAVTAASTHTMVVLTPDLD